jgi:hypothetical protein
VYKAKGVSFGQFFHRRNSDLTVDSICGYCLVTAATAANETELHAKEFTHRCIAKNGTNASIVAQYEPRPPRSIR